VGHPAAIHHCLRTRQDVDGSPADEIETLTLGRDICGDWEQAVDREWLVTNGLGGFACGTVAGANTRRYHAFLMASLRPPVERMLMVAKVDVTVDYLGVRYPLSANEYVDGTVDPRGFVHLESFDVLLGIPVWRYALGDALLEQRIFMAPEANTTYLSIKVLRAAAPLRVELKPLCGYRDYHSQQRGALPLHATAQHDGCAIDKAGVPLIRLKASGGHYLAGDTWYWNFLHREEAARGLDAIEDLWGPGTFHAELSTGSTLFFTASAEQSEPAAGDEVYQSLESQTRALIAALPSGAPAWIQTLAVASDQFIVRRGAKEAAAVSVIAGYPWFTDWGRDTMISLPGLTLTLGRFDKAAAILRTFAGVIDRGMLPNRFADAGEALEYNTADATLWMFQALSQYLDARPDPDLLRELFPKFAACIHAHVEGTRYGIKVADDGLLHAGEAGMQLTWMDAKHGDEVFTPRIGKPVEINALWLNALEVTARLAGQLRNDIEKNFSLALLNRAEQSFGRFWNKDLGCLYDVIDVDGTTTADASIRPNQLFAVSLPFSALSTERMRAVVDTCARELLTSYGLRSLAPTDPAYRGHYVGDARQRDAAYHQGTVWSWLLGPFAIAHFRVYGDVVRAQAFLAPIAEHLGAACMGTVSEVFDGDAPHIARGCFAQAWSVAEILRAWDHLHRRKVSPGIQ
jgi:predicted glycogen debranching enzyme